MMDAGWNAGGHAELGQQADPPAGPAAAPADRPESPLRSGSGALPVLLALAIAAAVALVYLPALQTEFVNWGDEQLQAHDVRCRGLAWNDLRWMFTTTQGGRYQPLTWLSFAVDWQIWGWDAFGYHLTNLILHAINAVLFFTITRTLLIIAVPAWKRSEFAVSAGAAVAAIVFALHPLRVGAVAWASQRGDLLAAFFWLSGVLLYLQAHDARERGRRATGWMAGTVVMAALAALARVHGATLVFALLLLDVYPLRRFRSAAGRTSGRVWWEKLPLAAVAVVMAVIALRVRDDVVPSEVFPVVDAGARWLQGFFGLSLFAWKTVWPVNLSPMYDLPRAAAAMDKRFLAGSAAVLAAGAVFWSWRRRWPAPLIAWGLYVALLLTTTTLVPINAPTLADRHTYLATLGLAVIAGAGAAWCLQALRAGRIRWPAAGAAAIAVAATAFTFTTRTAAQIAVWRHSESVWQQILANYPESFSAYLALGQTYFDGNAAEEAAAAYRAALGLRPDSPQANAGLGFALYETGETAGAIQSFQKALDADARSELAHLGLGLVLLDQDKVEEAVRHLQESLSANERNLMTRRSLGHALVKLKRYDEAIAVYKRAIELRPSVSEFYQLAGSAMTEARRYGDAAKIMRAGLKAGDEPVSLANNLAWLLATCPEAEHRDGAEAVQLAQFACEATMNQVAGYIDTLAAAYAEVGRFEDAVRAQKAALLVAERSRERPEEIAAFRARLALFEKREPYREEPGQQ